MHRDDNIQSMIGRVPEQDLWRALQEAVADGAELSDKTILRLDSRMQGFLFLQEHIGSRESRIAFACSKQHMPYLRDAAGSRNVWMTDTEFSALVEQDDGETLACFARSERMAPHQLMYIEYKLTLHPHRQELLATAYDAMITTRKALERRGSTRGMALMRLAKAALEGSTEIGTELAGRLRRSVVIPAEEPRALWRAYLNLNSLDAGTLLQLLESAGTSSSRPFGTSGKGGWPLH